MNLFVALVTMSLVSAAPPEFSASTVDGSQTRGTLAGWDDQAVTLNAGDSPQRLPLDKLLSIVPNKPPTAAPTADTIWVTLTDGSLIAAASYQAEAGTAKAATNRMGFLNLPSGSVDHVRFQTGSPAMEQRWQEMLEKEITEDVLVLVSGETLDYLGGIVRAVREQQVDFDLDGDVVPVRRGKVYGIRFYRSNRGEAFEPMARLSDDSGSTWRVQRVATNAADGTLTADTPLGIRLNLPLEAVTRIEFAGSGRVFLSDLTADSVHWTPYFGRPESVTSLEKLYRPRRNATLDSAPIVLDGIPCEHGLTLHSRTEMTFRLAESFERFQATAGIDDRVRPGGNVMLKVLGDNRIVYQATIAGTHPAQKIDVSLKGVKTLTILVDFGSDLDVGDHLILAEARLLK